MISNIIKPIHDFLRLSTPIEWVRAASNNMALILIDHAHCERKAATTAIHLMAKYPGQKEINQFLSPLIREELLHFDKVLNLIDERNIQFGPLKPSLYAQKLHHHVSNRDHLERLSDQLIIGAIIEARSCERFAALVPVLTDEALVKFYSSLVKAEARHFEDYLKHAKMHHPHSFEKRLEQFLDIENEWIGSHDKQLRFHGGIPSS